ncbi:nitroreductase [Breznakibacter xylanolyticus]|uniref:Nitroreductase n=1 Tax=Breznakibacter xylanolyticus TaxID=990 RepID=A0A2W7NIX6_9BACT|nr:nitroreductase family protein [Breznakibacter xylanolyticus]PZX20411.1 nitroreductase [Breznakibacter xylanolyticus]
MNQLNINNDACTRCGACIDSCPVNIIEADDNRFPLLTAQRNAYCIQCFHCEAVCPTQALSHPAATQGMSDVKQSEHSISAHQLGQYMQQRRSIRQFKAQKITPDTLQQAMDAVRYAPTGTNRQLNHWILINDDALIHDLADGTIQWMRQVVAGAPEMGARYNFSAIIANWEAGIDRICRHAPHLAICYTPTAHPVGSKDAVIATAHLELFLPSVGIGSCWAGFLMIAIEQMPLLKQRLGLTADHTVHAALMLGYPKYKYKRIPARDAAKVIWL